MDYQEKLDQLFGNGSMWKHRTFRTVLDPYSTEYSQTTIDEKVEFLKKWNAANHSLAELILEYKMYYHSINKSHVAKAVEDGLVNLTSSLIDMT